jgi:hypothetical protein
MSETLRRVQTLVLAGDYLVGEHGFDELAEDGILPSDLGISVATPRYRRLEPWLTTIAQLLLRLHVAFF